MSSAPWVLTPEVPESLRRGWDIRLRNFGADVSFFAPSLKRFHTAEFAQRCDCAFPAVSITGSQCHLNCDHCRAEILRHMRPAITPEALLKSALEFAGRGASGMLISGGSDRMGTVPLEGFLGAISQIKEDTGLKIIVHTGITGRSLAVGLAEAGVDVALIDMIGDEAALRRVCHLDAASVSDYEQSLSHLCEAGVPAAPHVVIGLDHGVIGGEFDALQVISRYPVSQLVLVGLSPKRGTPMEKATPPSPEEMGEIFLSARELMPSTPIMLGCERAAGEHKLMTDQFALKAGLNGISYPAEGIVALAEEMGLKPVFSEACCVLSPVSGPANGEKVQP